MTPQCCVLTLLPCPPAPHYFWLFPQRGVMSVHKDSFLSFMGLTALPANAHPIRCHRTLLFSNCTVYMNSDVLCALCDRGETGASCHAWMLW